MVLELRDVRLQQDRVSHHIVRVVQNHLLALGLLNRQGMVLLSGVLLRLMVNDVVGPSGRCLLRRYSLRGICQLLVG